MSRTINCEVCKKQGIVATTGTQRTCLAPWCRAEIRSRTRKDRYYEARPDPTCIWCEEPILEARKRRYHDECREDKNRLRLRAYHKTHKIRPATKKPRHYEGTISCAICRTKVPKTGARQTICKARECTAARKNQRKREGKARRREIAEIRALKQEQFAKQRPTRQPDVIGLFIRQAKI